MSCPSANCWHILLVVCGTPYLVIIQQITELGSCVLVTAVTFCQGICLYQQLTMVTQLTVQLLDLLSIKSPGTEIWLLRPQVACKRRSVLHSWSRTAVNLCQWCRELLVLAHEVASWHTKHLIWHNQRKTPVHMSLTRLDLCTVLEK